MPEEPERRRDVVSHRSRNSDTAKEIFSRLGIDIDNVEDVRELAADLYFIRRQRHNAQTRVTMTWTSVIAAVVSAIVGAAGVVISNLLHKGAP